MEKLTVDRAVWRVAACLPLHEDVHDADAICGQGNQAFRGKINKGASVAATSVLASHVTQFLTIQIFFVLEIPFLLRCKHMYR